MGRIIAVTNLKGGIGKTTTVVNVGAGLALKGARVLLVDVDAQGNLAPALGVKPKRTVYDILVDNADPVKCITPARPNLDLIAGDDTLLSAQPIISKRPDWSRVLEQNLSSIKREYDFVFIDVPGSLTVLSVNALSASTDLLVPTTVETLSLKGLDLLFKQVTRLKVTTRSIRLIVPTLFDSRLRQSTVLLEQLREQHGSLIAEPIRINVRLSEAIAAGRTIYEHDARSRGALDYARLVDHLSKLWNFHPAPQQPDPAAQNGTHTSATSSQHAQQPLPAANGTHSESISAEAENGHEPVVTGAGNMSQNTCPHCGRLLRRATVAGYRIAFCDHCRYKQQELVQRSRT